MKSIFSKKQYLNFGLVNFNRSAKMKKAKKKLRVVGDAELFFVLEEVGSLENS